MSHLKAVTRLLPRLLGLGEKGEGEFINILLPTLFSESQDSSRQRSKGSDSGDIKNITGIIERLQDSPLFFPVG